MSGSLSVISDLSKIQVYDLAKWINKKYSNLIPKNIINKPPSAELAQNQVDPFDYSIVSPLVDEIIEKNISPKELIKNGFDKDLVMSIYNRIKSMEYKRRQSPIGFKISKKAFGLGRRVPIVNHFKG
jgi:NAD+ synthase (glutamine-hydrolysing)